MLNYIKALFIAVNAHRGQYDKGGNPYIFHPLAVSNMVKGIENKVVALLHDVLEDSSLYTINDFAFLNESQRNALILLTHSPNDTYEEYIQKIKSNKIAKEVKIADLTHNSNLDRIDKPTINDQNRVIKYRQSIKTLTE